MATPREPIEFTRKLSDGSTQRCGNVVQLEANSAVDPATQTIIAQFGGHENVIAIEPIITAGAYHAKDAVGGRLNFVGAARFAKGSGIIQAVTVIDRDSEAAELILVLFSRAFTASIDNAAFDPTDADLLYCIGKITIGAADYTAFADNSVAQVRNLGIPFVCGLDDTLYGQLMCTGTPTYTATSDLVVKLHIMQD